MDFLKDFGVDLRLLAAQVVNFLLLLFILRKLLYGPLLKVLEERKQKISISLKQAEEIEARLQKTEEDREKALEKATLEAQKIVNEATASANQIIADARLKATGDIELMIARGQEATILDREKMQQELREELADLVVKSLEKITGKMLSKKVQRDLVERSVKELN